MEAGSKHTSPVSSSLSRSEHIKLHEEKKEVVKALKEVAAKITSVEAKIETQKEAELKLDDEIKRQRSKLRGLKKDFFFVKEQTPEKAKLLEFDIEDAAEDLNSLLEEKERVLKQGEKEKEYLLKEKEYLLKEKEYLLKEKEHLQGKEKRLEEKEMILLLCQDKSSGFVKRYLGDQLTFLRGGVREMEVGEVSEKPHSQRTSECGTEITFSRVPSKSTELNIEISLKEWLTDVKEVSMHHCYKDICERLEQPVFQSNCEAMSRTWIHILVRAAIEEHGDKLSMFGEIRMQGKIAENTKGNGSVDVVIYPKQCESSPIHWRKVLGMIEAKKPGETTGGVSQFAAELIACSRQARKEGIDVVYGALTDGIDWKFGRCEGGKMVELSSRKTGVIAFSWLCMIVGEMCSQLTDDGSE